MATATLIVLSFRVLFELDHDGFGDWSNQSFSRGEMYYILTRSVVLHRSHDTETEPGTLSG